jgi:predicted RNase H-like nuclease
MPPMHIIGVDWAATDEAKCGLALARHEGDALEVIELLTGREASEKSSGRIARWIDEDTDVLVAIDAPLGWPRALMRAVASHRAGEPLGTMKDAATFFSRETDRHVRKVYGKTPLEVGADRIARTAFSALALVATLRARAKLDVAWRPDERGVIEVYPAATLTALTAKKVEPYKKRDQVPERAKIVNELASHVTINASLRRRALEVDHLLDAVVCAVAGADFVSGKAIAPDDAQLELAQTEGWIWVRSPSKPALTSSL